jgi:methylated-DNA-[protein]-cysteine S-methyltransferase
MRLEMDRLGSPCGALLAVCSETELVTLEFEVAEAVMHERLARRFGADIELAERSDPLGVTGRLRAYFAGEIEAIDGIPADGGGTPFQRKVWRQLRRIPAGRTWTYAELARRIDQPTATRAVGHANGANPIAIVVPCHRVIGADGKLVGYTAGIKRKLWLLQHEGAQLQLV